MSDASSTDDVTVRPVCSSMTRMDEDEAPLAVPIALARPLNAPSRAATLLSPAAAARLLLLTRLHLRCTALSCLLVVAIVRVVVVAAVVVSMFVSIM